MNPFVIQGQAPNIMKVKVLVDRPLISKFTQIFVQFFFFIRLNINLSFTITKCLKNIFYKKK